MIRIAVLTLGIIGSTTMAFGESNGFQPVGTAQQRAACGPDVRRYCRNLRETDGPFAYLQCFETNRNRLSARCVGLLQSYDLYF